MSVKWYCLLQLARPQRLRTRYANVWPHAELERTQIACCMVLFVASFVEPFFLYPFFVFGRYDGMSNRFAFSVYVLKPFVCVRHTRAIPNDWWSQALLNPLKQFHSSSFVSLSWFAMFLVVWAGHWCNRLISVAGKTSASSISAF